ncbi:MAG: PAS domain S-box protein [Candidatus Competibacter sp.]|nr:PAS domain S-box protein [Candidatus Competibacter sp.]MDG4583834.1 PAS domain S-box protein [Candidatus Competibacter sp.]
MLHETQQSLLGRSRTLAPRHPSLAFKFPLFVLALLLVVIWGLALFADFFLKQHLERLLAAHQLAAISVIAESLDQEIRLRVRSIQDLAQAAGQREIHGSPERLRAFLQDQPAIAALFNGGLLALDASGVVLADIPAMPGRVGQSLAGWGDFAAALAQGEPVVGTLPTGASFVRPSMTIAAPVGSAFARPVGVLVGITRLDTASFISRIIGTYGGEHGSVLIIDPRSGRFVAATDPTRILQPIPAPGVNRMHDRHMRGHEDSGIAVSSRGIEELSSSRRIPATGWLAVGVLPTAEAFAPVKVIQGTILSTALALSVVVPLLAVWVTRRWLRPLRDATAALAEMTCGKRALEPLPVRTCDEIGQLIDSFNRLQARVRANERLLRGHYARLQTALSAARMRFFEWSSTAEEPVAADLLALVCPQDRERVAEIVGRACAARERFLTEFRSPGSNGSEAWFIARGQVSREDPEPGVIAIVWDITEFKLAELALYENEERFEAIVDSLNDAVFLQNGQTGEFLYTNGRASELFGYSRGTFSRLTFDALCADDEATQRRALDQLAQAFEHDDPQCFECLARNAGGRQFWIEANVRAAWIGNARRLVVVVRDIDDRKLAARTLLESEKRYRTLLDLSPDAIFVHRDGVMTMVNRSALRLFGADSEARLLGLPWRERIHPDSHEAVAQRLRAVRDSEQPIILPAMEQRHLRVDGSPIEVEVTSSSILLAEGRAMLSIARDITQRKQDEARLKSLLAQREAILDNVLVGIVLFRQRVITQCNRRFEELFGYGEGEMLGCATLILYPTAEDFQTVGERAYNALAGGGTYVEELWLKRKDGSLFWGCLNGRALDSSQPQEGSVWIYSDLTAQKQGRERLRLVASVFESAAEGIVITDPDRTILAINPAFSEITGYAAEEVLGRSPNLLQSGRHDTAFFQHMWRSIEQNGKWRGEIWNRRKNGEVYPELLSISTVKDQAGCVTHYVGVFTDIAAIKSFERQLIFLAHHDPLTELPNRSLFNDRLTQGILHAARDNTRLAVLFIDLDHFKNVNDTLGHQLGDRLLQMVAEELRKPIRACDTLARLGGDEFILLIERIDSHQDATMVAHKLLAIFEKPFLLAEHDIHISASIGISYYPADGRDCGELVKNADAAMYQAKAKGRNNYHLYAREMTTNALERLRLEAMLRRSVRNDELVVHFQPQVDMASGALIGAEALVRWNHPELGLILPGKFVFLAEETGFIATLGEWVLRESCAKLQAWRAAGYPLGKISVNFSIRQFERGDMTGLIEAILAENGLPPECLEIEITESFIVKTEDAFRFFGDLRALGVHLAVDDFGTGYSSLMYLKRLPIQRLKIDRSFVADIGRDPNNEAIIRAIIVLAGNLGLSVIAEGVETEMQADFLRREGCPHGQGHYFGRPLPEDEFVARWLSV